MGNLHLIISQDKTDTESVYNTWFVNNDARLKAFRTIRRGVLQVIEDIKKNCDAICKFGTDYSVLDKIANSIL